MLELDDSYLSGKQKEKVKTLSLRGKMKFNLLINEEDNKLERIKYYINQNKNKQYLYPTICSNDKIRRLFSFFFFL